MVSNVLSIHRIYVYVYGIPVYSMNCYKLIMCITRATETTTATTPTYDPAYVAFMCVMIYALAYMMD